MSDKIIKRLSFFVASSVSLLLFSGCSSQTPVVSVTQQTTAINNPQKKQSRIQKQVQARVNTRTRTS